MRLIKNMFDKISLPSLGSNKSILANNEGFKSIYFFFEKGKGLPNHTHDGFATIQIISGSFTIEFVGKETFTLGKGDFLEFNARDTHNVIANEAASVIITISK